MLQCTCRAIHQDTIDTKRDSQIDQKRPTNQHKKAQHVDTKDDNFSTNKRDLQIDTKETCSYTSQKRPTNRQKRHLSLHTSQKRPTNRHQKDLPLRITKEIYMSTKRNLPLLQHTATHCNTLQHTKMRSSCLYISKIRQEKATCP